MINKNSPAYTPMSYAEWRKAYSLSPENAKCMDCDGKKAEVHHCDCDACDLCDEACDLYDEACSACDGTGSVDLSVLKYKAQLKRDLDALDGLIRRLENNP